jgi:hypothetical protein
MGNAIIVRPTIPSAVTAEGSGAGTLPGYLFNDWMGVVHRGTATGNSGRVTVDFGAGGLPEIDTVAFLSSNGACTQLSHKAATSQAGLATPAYNSGLVPFPAGATVPVTGRQNSLFLIGASQVYRWWEFEISTPGATPFDAGRLVLGKRYQPARNFSFGAAFGVIDRGGGDFNTQGVWLPKSGVMHRTIGLSFGATTRQEAETILQPLLETIGNSVHVLVVTDPDADALRQRRMYFGPLVGNLETLWRVADGYEWRANLVSTI